MRVGSRTVRPKAHVSTVLVLFDTTALICGLANSLELLLVARILQGCAGALLLPVGRIIVLRSADQQDFVKAMAVMTMPIMLGPVIGPTLGGYLVTALSWRWLFLAIVPLAAIGVLLVLFYVEEQPKADIKLDLAGSGLIIVSLLALVFGLGAITQEDVSGWIIVSVLVIGLSTGGVYVRHARQHPAPVLSLKSFSRFPSSLDVE